MCLYGGGFIWENDQREGLTCKRAKGGGVLYRVGERGRVFFGKVAILFLLPSRETEEGGEWGAGGPVAGVLGLCGGRGRGKGVGRRR